MSFQNLAELEKYFTPLNIKQIFFAECDIPFLPPPPPLLAYFNLSGRKSGLLTFSLLLLNVKQLFFFLNSDMPYKCLKNV